MTPNLVIAVIGSIVTLLFDTIGSFASRSLGFRYGWLTIGSAIIYFGVGFATVRYNGLIWAVLTAALVALVDSTIGWFISIQIGPGRPTTELNLNTIIATIVFVVCFAAVCGLLGGMVDRKS